MASIAPPAKTVLLLGAGASRASDFHLPTMRGFFDLADVPDDLKTFLHHFYRGIPAADFDLETVLADLTLSVQRLPRWAPDERVRHNIGAHYPLGDLLWYVSRRLKTDPARVCQRHKDLFRKLEVNDTVLTLNYDVVADQVLSLLDRDAEHPDRFRRFSRMDKLMNLVGDARLMAGEPMTLLPQEQDGGFYLKLHGSLDWLRCTSLQCPNGRRFYPLSGETITAGQEPGKPCRLCGAVLQAVLIPPLPDKTEVFEGRFGVLWNLALRELQAATRIVVVGVAFARSDFELSWLIRLSSATRFHDLELVAVNPVAGDRDAARRLFAPTKFNGFSGLDEYLAA
jgi:hypothetical protein